MTEVLSKESLALIERPIIAHLATIDSKGRPQITALWIDHDGNDILVNTAEGRAKANNMRRDPEVGISLVDPQNPYAVVSLRGKVTDITTDGADAHIDSLAKKYMGVDRYPNRTDDEVRIKVRISPEHIFRQPAE
jgi:PPOX class probable F420-dependent enzyme